jgi:hypothetical protein
MRGRQDIFKCRGDVLPSEIGSPCFGVVKLSGQVPPGGAQEETVRY